MNYALLDTCVWLTIAPDEKLKEIPDAILSLLDHDQLRILLPVVIEEEFLRNKEEIKKKRIARFKTLIKHSREIGNFLEGIQKEALDTGISTLENDLPSHEAKITETLQVIERIFKHEHTIRLTNEGQVYEKVINRGLQKLAPFHRAKNSVADCIIIEMFADYISELELTEQTKVFFVSENKSDFSDPQKANEPHPDFSHFFEAPSFFYSINISSVLNQIQENIITEATVKDYTMVSASTANLCKDGKPHQFSDARGAWLRSQYGGLTWQLLCENCGARFDTGDFWD